MISIFTFFFFQKETPLHPKYTPLGMERGGTRVGGASKHEEDLLAL